MNRFFKKSDNISTVSDEEVAEFLHQEGLNKKVNVTRVHDFYNALSTKLYDGKIYEEENVDYEVFNAHTKEDYQKIDDLKGKEKDYLGGVDKDLLAGGRMLKAAAALAHRFEDMMSSGEEMDASATSYLKNLFECEDMEIGEGKRCTFAELLEQDVEFLKFLALLSHKKAFTPTGKHLVEDKSGKIVKYRPIEGIGDIVNLDLVQFAMPDFQKKLATEDLYKKTRMSKQDKCQNLVILIDDSGSMSGSVKKAMLKAALTLKLNDWSDRNNIYIGTFITEVYGFIKVDRKMKFEDLDFIELNKGTTDVGGCVKYTIDQIKKGSLPGGTLHRGNHPLSDAHFEILVVNDGDDRVDSTYHPAIKMHALTLLGHNPDLKDICLRSGGTYNHLKRDEK